MHANSTTPNVTRTALTLLMAASVLSGGCAAVHHALHYNPVAEAMHEHHQAYYHSPHTGRVVPKEHVCVCPVELPCFGYEPTCWHRWPAECVKCPLQGEEVIIDVPYGSVPLHEEVIVEPTPEGAVEALPEGASQPVPPPTQDSARANPSMEPSVPLRADNLAEPPTATPAITTPPVAEPPVVATPPRTAPPQKASPAPTAVPSPTATQQIMANDVPDSSPAPEPRVRPKTVSSEDAPAAPKVEPTPSEEDLDRSTPPEKRESRRPTQVAKQEVRVAPRAEARVMTPDRSSRRQPRAAVVKPTPAVTTPRVTPNPLIAPHEAKPARVETGVAQAMAPAENRHPSETSAAPAAPKASKSDITSTDKIVMKTASPVETLPRFTIRPVLPPATVASQPAPAVSNDEATSPPMQVKMQSPVSIRFVAERTSGVDAEIRTTAKQGSSLRFR